MGAKRRSTAPALPAFQALISARMSTATFSDAATETLVREFDLSQVPVAIAQRDGYVVGAAYGSAIEALAITNADSGTTTVSVAWI